MTTPPTTADKDREAAEAYLREFGPCGYSFIATDVNFDNHKRIFLAALAHARESHAAEVEDLIEVIEFAEPYHQGAHSKVGRLIRETLTRYKERTK